ncbi:hypothetical protein D3C71_1493470 [compost metagenome]
MFMGDVPGPFALGCQAFANVMQQTGPAHGQRLLVCGGLFKNAQGMEAAVDFRVVGFRLRHAEQRINLGHQHLQCVAVPEYLDENLRLVFHQGAGYFFPAAFGSQRLKFA